MEAQYTLRKSFVAWDDWNRLVCNWARGTKSVPDDGARLTGGQKSSCMSTTSSAGRNLGSAMTAAELIVAYSRLLA
jgi:hypothetical protein